MYALCGFGDNDDDAQPNLARVVVVVAAVKNGLFLYTGIFFLLYESVQLILPQICQLETQLKLTDAYQPNVETVYMIRGCS